MDKLSWKAPRHGTIAHHYFVSTKSVLSFFDIWSPSHFFFLNEVKREKTWKFGWQSQETSLKTNWLEDLHQIKDTGVLTYLCLGVWRPQKRTSLPRILVFRGCPSHLSGSSSLVFGPPVDTAFMTSNDNGPAVSHTCFTSSPHPLQKLAVCPKRGESVHETTWKNQHISLGCEDKEEAEVVSSEQTGSEYIIWRSVKCRRTWFHHRWSS